MTEETQKTEISLIRLLLAIIKTNGVVTANVADYMSDDINNKGLSVELGENNTKFIINLVDNPGGNNEPRPDGE